VSVTAKGSEVSKKVMKRVVFCVEKQYSRVRGRVVAPDKLLGEVEKWLLVVEVGLGRDIVVAKVLLPVRNKGT